MEAWVQYQDSSCRFVLVKVLQSQIPSEYFGFILPIISIIIPSMLHTHLSLPLMCVTSLTSQHIITALVLSWVSDMTQQMARLRVKTFNLINKKCLMKNV